MLLRGHAHAEAVRARAAPHHDEGDVAPSPEDVSASVLYRAGANAEEILHLQPRYRFTTRDRDGSDNLRGPAICDTRLPDFDGPMAT
jgi:hypothetical protein